MSSSLFAGWFVETGRLLLPAAGADATATRPLAAVGREENRHGREGDMQGHPVVT